jgi:hypothetical protein
MGKLCLIYAFFYLRAHFQERNYRVNREVAVLSSERNGQCVFPINTKLFPVLVRNAKIRVMVTQNALKCLKQHQLITQYHKMKLTDFAN